MEKYSKWLILVVMALLLSSNTVMAFERPSISVVMHFETEDTSQVKGLIEHFLKQSGMSIETNSMYTLNVILDDVRITNRILLSEHVTKIVFLAVSLSEGTELIGVFKAAFNAEDTSKKVKDTVSRVTGYLNKRLASNKIDPYALLTPRIKQPRMKLCTR